MLIDDLIRLDLTRKEAQAYTMLLRIGASPVSSLARRTSLKRVTLYSVLESLVQKGLIGYEVKKGVRYYIPYDPECLVDRFTEELARLKMKLSLARDCAERLEDQSSIQTNEEEHACTCPLHHLKLAY